ncbi:MAG: hypothetical protein Q4B35_06490 [Slackia sp.]|nr:hypothetical protein [Slackia sp.]
MEPRQTPTFSANLPSLANTDGPDAADIAGAFFGKPMEWQRFVLNGLLARGKRDKYAARAYALSVPRQNGKSWIVRARCFYGMVFCGEKILYTCQHGDTADEMFKALSEVFEDEENDELADLLRAVRKTNGQQAIYLQNGGCVRFTTRTNSLARGKTFDVLVYDEAQELTVGQQAASLPTISAGALKNPQTIYLGTPPDPESVGTVFTSMRQQVLSGESTAAWVEWSADEIGDTTDPARWYESNPSLGYRISVEAVEAEASSMPPDSFARERLGWWSPTARVTRAIPKKLWEESAIDGIDGRRYRLAMAFGVKFSIDGSVYVLAGCKIAKSGEAAVEVIEVGSTAGGTASLAAALAEKAGKASCVLVDGQAGAPALLENMRRSRPPKGYAVSATAAIVADAAGMFLDALREGTLKHTSVGQKMLDDSAVYSVRRSIGTSGKWGFGSSDEAESTAVEAASLAFYAARTSKRKPGRRQRKL